MANNFYLGEFDPRHIDGIIPEMRYTTVQAAEIIGCSRELIIKLCNRRNHLTAEKMIDPRHYQDFSEHRKYSDSEIARKLNVSHTTIYNLRKLGEFEETPLRKSVRVPGWSIIDFIKRIASPANGFQFIATGKIIRIPGWGIISHKKSFSL